MGRGMIQLGSVLVRVSRVGLADADVAVTAAVSISAAPRHHAQMIDRCPGTTATRTSARLRNHRGRSPGHAADTGRQGAATRDAGREVVPVSVEAISWVRGRPPCSSSTASVGIGRLGDVAVSYTGRETVGGLPKSGTLLLGKPVELS
jgi:hypothetical protein